MEVKSEKRKVPESLPESGDKEFWGDADQPKIKPVDLGMKKTHEWKQKGHEAICQTCPLAHGIYLGPDQEVREGKIVKKLPPKP